MKKKCPNCHQKTIPLNWILFHQIFKKDCNFFICNHCKKNIRTGHLFNFDMIYFPLYDPLILIALLFLLYQYTIITTLSILGYMIGYILLFLLQQCIVPLEISVEEKCDTKGLTRIQALLSLVIMPTILIYAIYSLMTQ